MSAGSTRKNNALSINNGNAYNIETAHTNYSSKNSTNSGM